MNPVSAFMFVGNSNWKLSTADDWELTPYLLVGDEQLLGHHKIDGAICKILKSSDGHVIAISK